MKRILLVLLVVSAVVMAMVLKTPTIEIIHEPDAPTIELI
jgi:hypothetical protein